MRALITGGAGNLGSWVARDFEKRGFDVWTLSRRPHPDNRTKHIELDVSDKFDCVEKLGSQAFDIVVSTASANDFAAPTYAVDAIDVNIKGLQNVASSLNRDALKHFIYVSTFHVYGVGEGRVSEETELAPRNDYGLTHLCAEQYLRKFHRADGFPFSIVRLTNSYGCPTQMDSRQWVLVLNDLARMAFEQKQIVLRSSGLARRDFIWMQDVCDALYAFANIEPTNDVFNLSRGESIRLLDIAKEVQDAYQDVLGASLEITRNLEDKTASSELIVNHEKLSGLFDFKPSDAYKSEAKAIFEMLRAKA